MATHYKESDGVDTDLHVYTYRKLGLYLQLNRDEKEEGCFYIPNKNKDQLDRLIAALQTARKEME
jgi:hypothetical protein